MYSKAKRSIALEECAMFYEMGRTSYETMVQDGFQFAEPFEEET